MPNESTSDDNGVLVLVERALRALEYAENLEDGFEVDIFEGTTVVKRTTWANGGKRPC